MSDCFDHALDAFMCEREPDFGSPPDRNFYHRKIDFEEVGRSAKAINIKYLAGQNHNDENVYVYLIADGRRDMQSLLQRRLLGVL